jgi:hypothetical protein
MRVLRRWLIPFAIAYLVLLAAVASVILHSWTAAIRHGLPILFVIVLGRRYLGHHKIVGWRIGVTDALILFVFTALQIASLPLLRSWPQVFLLLGMNLAIGGIAYSFAGARWSEPYVLDVLDRYFKGSQSREGLWYAILGFEARCARMALLGSLALAVMSAASKWIGDGRVSAAMAGAAVLGAVACLRHPGARDFRAAGATEKRYEEHGRRVGNDGTTTLRFLLNTLRAPWSPRRARLGAAMGMARAQ